MAMLDNMKASPIAIAGKPKHGKPKRLIGARTRKLAYIIIGAALKPVAPDLLANVEEPKAKAEEMHPWNRSEAACFFRRVDEGRDPNRTLYRVALRTGQERENYLPLGSTILTPLLAASALRKATMRSSGRTAQRKLLHRAAASRCHRGQSLPSKSTFSRPKSAATIAFSLSASFAS